MGIILPLKLVDNHIELHIPEKYIPPEAIKEKLKAVKVKKPRILETTAYIYGGGGVKIRYVYRGMPPRPYAVKIPRTGVSGLIEKGIPLDLTLTHVYHDGVWEEVKEKPVLHPTTWTKRRWRAEIPSAIRYKYIIEPGTPVRLSYTEYITEWVKLKTARLTIYCYREKYEVYYNAKTRKAVWRIPEDIECYTNLQQGFIDKTSPSAECHFDGNKIYIDFIFSGFAGKFISSKTRYAYRSMAVRNYTTIEDTDYPFLAEIRAFIITTCPKTFYQDKTRYMKLLDALRITCENMVYFFTTSIRAAEKKGSVYYETKPIYLVEQPEVETYGEEDNVKVSYGETEPYPYYRVIKYIRIINEETYKRRSRKPYVYHNDRIERDLHMSGIVEIDKHGFVWLRR